MRLRLLAQPIDAKQRPIMKTVDIHTHLLNPNVRFQRIFDRIAVRFFARGLGMDPRRLLAHPYECYVESMAAAVRQSRYVSQTCLFGVDARLDHRGRLLHSDPTVCTDSSEVIQVARRHPDVFIPFCSVNPRRPDAVELLERYASEGCRGAKFLQNYWHLDTNDTRYIPYYETLKRLQLPLIIHLGSEYSISAKREYEGIDMLQLPLACGVTVIAAHMALGQLQHFPLPWRNLSRQPAYLDADYHRLLEKLVRHDNLYADIAAILAPLRARGLEHLSRQTQIHHKLLFATDYPVPFTVGFNTHGLPRDEVRRIRQISNPFDRYTEVILQFFPADNPIYSNHHKVLRRSGTSPQHY